MYHKFEACTNPIYKAKLGVPDSAGAAATELVVPLVPNRPGFVQVCGHKTVKPDILSPHRTVVESETLNGGVAEIHKSVYLHGIDE